MDDIKFARFTKRDLVYSCINGQDLLATVLTPKKLQEHPPAQCPVLVHWHGGGFVLGHRMYAPWWPTWLATLRRQSNRILLIHMAGPWSLQYRRAPSSLVQIIDFSLKPMALTFWPMSRLSGPGCEMICRP